jgi:hypothetical protein
MQIRRAITNDTFVFLACFSTTSLAQVKSRQNEETLLAIDEFAQRNPEVPWLIPVRFDDCPIPGRGLGGGRTLGSLEAIDLFGDQGEPNGQRLIQLIRNLLGS